MIRTLTPAERLRLDQLRPVMRPLAAAAIEELRVLCTRRAFHPIVSEVLRSSAQQLERWAAGRAQRADGAWYVVDRRAIKTNAPPGSSAHEYGLAFDVMLYGDDQLSLPLRDRKPLADDHPGWIEWVAIVEANGLTSGAYFKGLRDCPHAEMKLWRNHKEG